MSKTKKPKEKVFTIDRRRLLKILGHVQYWHRSPLYHKLHEEVEERGKELLRKDAKYQRLTKRLRIVEHNCHKALVKRELQRKKLYAEFLTKTKYSPGFLARIQRYIEGEGDER